MEVKKNRIFTQEQRNSFLRQIEEKRTQGVSVKRACDELGIHWSLYYVWSNHKPKGTPIKTRALPEKREQTLIPLLPAKNSKLVALVGSVEDVLEAVRTLQ